MASSLVRNETIPSPSLLNLGGEFLIPSDVIATEYCSGIKKGIELVEDASGSQKNKLIVECQKTAVISTTLSDNDKQLMNNPQFAPSFLSNIIQIMRLDAKTGATTQIGTQLVANSVKIAPKSTLNNQEQTVELSRLSAEILNTKFCAGVTKGHEIALLDFQLDPKQYKLGCNKDTTKSIHVFGIQRKELK